MGTLRDEQQTLVAYRVRVLPAQHQLDIELTLSDVPPGHSVRLEVPTWVPGRYSFQPVARDLFCLRAEDLETGDGLIVSREGWQAFRVACRGPFRIRYTAAAYDWHFSESCGIVDHEFAVLTGARYLRCPSLPDRCRVTYELPVGWAIHHPAGARRMGEYSWEYPTYEVLLDSPVAMGRFELLQRQVRGTPFYFLFLNGAIGFEQGAGSFVESLAGIGEQLLQIFGSFPFENYTFILSTSPQAHWGLEHRSSSMCTIGPDVFYNFQQNARAKRVCAHELFHAWNVRALRPAPLGEPDLLRGSFSEGLWMAEGFTRYYEFLLCVRAGIYSPEQFFSSVVNYYRRLLSLPAYGRVSAIDSSYATYVNHGKFSGSCNSSIDYYGKGMLVAFDVDSELRLGDRDDSLDRWFGSFYREHVTSRLGYTTEDVIRSMQRTNRHLAGRLQREVSAAGGLDIEGQLQRLGFEVEWSEKNYLGLVFNDPEETTIHEVYDESPAGGSGLAIGDSLLGIGDFAFDMRALEWLTSAGVPMRLKVARGHRLITFELAPAKRRTISGVRWQGGSLDAARIRTWLHRPEFEPGHGQPISLEFHEDFHGSKRMV